MNHRTLAVTSAATLTLIAAALTGCAADGSTQASGDCTPDASITTVTPGTLTIGVTDTPPFSSNVTGGGAAGVDIDILNQAAANLCLGVAYVAATYSNSIPLITDQKQIDLTTGDWYPTTARAEKVGFTSPNYYDAMGIVSEEGFDTVEELTTVGTVGTVAGYLWEEDLKTLLGDKLQTYQSSFELSQDVQNGRLDAGVDSYGVAASLYSDPYQVTISEPDDRVTATVEKAQSAFPIAKDNTALTAALNEQIEAFREDGTLVQILEDNGLSADLAVPAGVELKLIG